MPDLVNSNIKDASDNIHQKNMLGVTPTNMPALVTNTTTDASDNPNVPDLNDNPGKRFSFSGFQLFF